MKKLIMTTAFAALISGAAFAQDGSMTPAIDVSSAKVDGTMITGVTVTIDKPGYLVIHNEGDGAPPASLGHVPVEPGTTENVSIEAPGPLDPESGLSLMLHYETNDNTSYDFGPDNTEADTPAMAGNAVVSQPVGGAM